ncbi:MULTISPECIES: hypothetical protein [Paenibacillus]|uniref:hypothetical protein n=1 Tax=Paenibacillus TaxID=44249 RepID=UPI0009564535|nr:MULTISPECIES: hypothetical protein [Paenibacillus]ASS68157.1 hypothetical protein CIC07_19975 [Paenibacillus sp. RUD330]MEC0246357.1 hypothetical protein [Paenibacillus chitinolyticus]SIR69264.1 hypothetical protein SAMN05880555_4755 [Paenibacillus sp. RU4X]SIR76583.1 hypothetical protein SAMN05880570_4757 [Paenibacillus sp. RU4T]
MKITHTQAIGYLIAAVEKVQFPEAMDAAYVVLTFEELLNELSSEEAEKIYREVWLTHSQE